MSLSLSLSLWVCVCRVNVFVSFNQIAWWWSVLLLCYEYKQNEKRNVSGTLLLITFSVISFSFREPSLSSSGISSGSCLSIVITGTQSIANITPKKGKMREREKENEIEEQKELQINTCVCVCVNYRNGWRTFRSREVIFKITHVVCTWWDRKMMELAPKKKKRREKKTTIVDRYTNNRHWKWAYKSNGIKCVFFRFWLCILAFHLSSPPIFFCFSLPVYVWNIQHRFFFHSPSSLRLIYVRVAYMPNVYGVTSTHAILMHTLAHATRQNHTYSFLII